MELIFSFIDLVLTIFTFLLITDSSHPRFLPFGQKSPFNKNLLTNPNIVISFPNFHNCVIDQLPGVNNLEMNSSYKCLSIPGLLKASLEGYYVDEADEQTTRLH